MPVRIEHGRPATMLTAAALAGQARKQEKLEIMQLDFDYKKSLREQDMAIDLEMDARSRLWEIEKMEISSRVDFQREEQQRQRKLDSIDSAIQQIDKEVLAGRITEKEAYPIKQKLEISKAGVSVPISAFPDDEEDRYGVRPYYLEPEFERDYPELAEAKKKEVISGQRRGTIPYYLDPAYIRTNPAVARQAQEARGIFLSDEKFDSLKGGESQMPLGDKQLDVGARVEEEAPVGEGRIRVMSPEGQTGTILESERQDYIDQGFIIVGESKPFRGVGATGAWEESPIKLPTPKHKPRVGTINWNRLMSKGFK